MTSFNSSLFDFQNSAVRESVDHALDIQTSCGAFKLSAFLNASDPVPAADEVWAMQNGVILAVWDLPQARVELLRASVRPRLPAGMQLDGCEAAVWRYRARSDGLALTLRCGWDILPEGADGGPESGQALDAQTWDVGSQSVTIGTEDSEWLAQRAARGLWMPQRLESELETADPYPVTYLSDGLQITLPDLAQGEIGQVHFVVAWAKRLHEKDASTWFAVDMPPERILEQAGCIDVLSHQEPSKSN